ncbi:ppGpp synthetase catalytic domain-containing protein (RelA/SpoT-type nucleotidyltranferase) [Variovorax sp. OK605]|uniref:GTP pyrophosphokinase n=1 Tax=Variovorax sp. OK605 TaxID=1855317 RepID=UPI0008E57D00|nr:hypothetical protein [Variovorax sp. OK605]SFO63546.1 ppGpp synthetase catalytic domain-containing protein (RelA/SpoT-type nucleotidyltranferase) [Variovorax sp. OK605]
MDPEIETIRQSYQLIEGRAQRFLIALTNEISELLRKEEVVLGVPIEGRVKSWESLNEKLERKSKKIHAAQEIDDLIGIRIIVLFRSSLGPTIEALKKSFTIISFEDTATRLSDSQFGYQSQHLMLKLPEAWLKLPTLNEFSEFRAEIQVRTVAQHIWAAASHKLQYKQEDNVPPPLRRTIHRISALLETADLELDRVLEEKQRYVDAISTPPIDKTPLNVDLLESVLDDLFEKKSKTGTEDYAQLLAELGQFNIHTTGELVELVEKNRKGINDIEAKAMTSNKEKASLRISRGVFYSHVGLVRAALKSQFGMEAWLKGNKAARSATRSSPPKL